jgi:vacuolar protein sorting-associated protein 41
MTLCLYRDESQILPAKTLCPVCDLPLQESPSSVVLLFLCRHVVHARHVDCGDELPPPPDPVVASVTSGGRSNRGISSRIA